MKGKKKRLITAMTKFLNKLNKLIFWSSPHLCKGASSSKNDTPRTQGDKIKSKKGKKGVPAVSLQKLSAGTGKGEKIGRTF